MAVAVAVAVAEKDCFWVSGVPVVHFAAVTRYERGHTLLTFGLQKKTRVQKPVLLKNNLVQKHVLLKTNLV